MKNSQHLKNKTFLQYFLIFPWTFEEMSKIDHHNLYLSIHYLLLRICSRKTNINFTKYHWNLVNNIKESSLSYTNPTKETVKSWNICSTNYKTKTKWKDDLLPVEFSKTSSSPSTILKWPPSPQEHEQLAAWGSESLWLVSSWAQYFIWLLAN